MSSTTAARPPFTAEDRDAARQALHVLLEGWHRDDGCSAEEYCARVTAARCRLSSVEQALQPQTETESVPLMVHSHPATGSLVTNAGCLPAADVVRVLGLTASQSPATV